MFLVIKPLYQIILNIYNNIYLFYILLCILLIFNEINILKAKLNLLEIKQEKEKEKINIDELNNKINKETKDIRVVIKNRFEDINKLQINNSILSDKLNTMQKIMKELLENITVTNLGDNYWYINEKGQQDGRISAKFRELTCKI